MINTFKDCHVIIKNGRQGTEPVMFIKDSQNHVYIIGISPEFKFDMSDEGIEGERWRFENDNAVYCGI